MFKEAVMKMRVSVFCLVVAVCAAGILLAQQSTPVTAIRAGRLIDPEAGTAAANQIILIEGERITAVGPILTIPAGLNFFRK